MSSFRTFIYKKVHRSGNITWVVKWKDPTTGRWNVTAGGKTEEEALIAEGDIRKKLYKGEDPKEKPEHKAELKVGELIDYFYQSPRFLNTSPHWQEVVKNQLDHVIRPQFGKQLLSQIKREHLFRFYLDLKAKGLSHSTINKYHQKFSMLSQLLHEISPGFSNQVPTAKEFRKFFPRQAPTREINFLTPQELEKVYKELQRCRSRLIPIFIRFLASTGMRRSEAISLRWEDVDFASGFIMIRRTKNGTMRKVPLEPESLAALAMLPQIQQREGFIFKNIDGNPFHPDSFLKPLKKAAKRAGITKRIDIHCLRHSWASNKIRSGWGIKKVSMILGHSDISITSEVYAHLLDGDLKVSDDFRFDKEKGSSNSNTVEEQRNTVAAIMGNLIHSLNQIPMEVIASGEFAQAIQNIIQTEMQSNVSEQQPLARLEENGSFVPLLHRKLQNDQNSNNKLNLSDNKANEQNANKKAGLAFASPACFNGGPDRARTCDLQIRSLTL